MELLFFPHPSWSTRFSQQQSSAIGLLCYDFWGKDTNAIYNIKFQQVFTVLIPMSYRPLDKASRIKKMRPLAALKQWSERYKFLQTLKFLTHKSEINFIRMHNHKIPD